MTSNVTPISLEDATQARLLSDQHLAQGDEKLETFVSLELFSDKPPQITHNQVSVERLLFAAKILEQYALGYVGSEPV